MGEGARRHFSIVLCFPFSVQRSPFRVRRKEGRKRVGGSARACRRREALECWSTEILEFSLRRLFYIFLVLGFPFDISAGWDWKDRLRERARFRGRVRLRPNRGFRLSRPTGGAPPSALHLAPAFGHLPRRPKAGASERTKPTRKNGQITSKQSEK